MFGPSWALGPATRNPRTQNPQEKEVHKKKVDDTKIDPAKIDDNKIDTNGLSMFYVQGWEGGSKASTFENNFFLNIIPSL